MTISLLELKNNIDTLQNRIRFVEESSKNKINFDKEMAKLIKNLTTSGFTRFGKLNSNKTHVIIPEMKGFIDGYEISTSKIEIDVSSLDILNQKYGIFLSISNKATYDKIKAENKKLIKNNEDDYFYIEIIKINKEYENKLIYDKIDKNLIIKDNKKSVYICNISKSSVNIEIEDKRIAIAMNGVFTVTDNYMPKNYDCIVKNNNTLYINGEQYLNMKVVQKVPDKGEMSENTIYLVAEEGDK